MGLKCGDKVATNIRGTSDLMLDEKGIALYFQE
jgi:hypothetical protein